MQENPSLMMPGDRGLRFHVRNGFINLLDGEGNNVLALDHLDECSRVSFISHAHADHVDKHGLGHFIASHGGNNPLILSSDETCTLIRERYGLIIPRETRIEPDRETRTWRFGKVSGSIIPNGHALGSTALVVHDSGVQVEHEYDIFYTGDFIIETGRLLPPLVPSRCDTLACECTFGMPFYEFPPASVLFGEIKDWIRESLATGPVILYGYSLGKNQELLWILDAMNLGCPVIADNETFALTSIYKDAGILNTKVEPYKVYGRKKFFEKSSSWVLLLPLHERFHERYQRFDAIPCRKAGFSGWALHPTWVDQMHLDAGFPLSDHPCFTQLISFIEKCQPRRLYLMHGNGGLVKHRLLERSRMEIKQMLGDVRIIA